MAEEGVIRLMVLDDSLLKGSDLTPEEFTSPMLGRYFALLREKAATDTELSPAVLSGVFTPEEEQHITKLLQKPEPPDDSGRKKALTDYIDIIREERDKRTAGSDPRAYAEKLRNKKGYGG